MEVPCRTYLGKTGLTFLLLSTFLFAHIGNNFFASAHLTRFPFVRKCSLSLGGRATDFSLLSRAERCGGGKEKVKVEKTRRAGLALSLSKPVFTLGSPPLLPPHSALPIPIHLSSPPHGARVKSKGEGMSLLGKEMLSITQMAFFFLPPRRASGEFYLAASKYAALWKREETDLSSLPSLGDDEEMSST